MRFQAAPAFVAADDKLAAFWANFAAASWPVAERSSLLPDDKPVVRQAVVAPDPSAGSETMNFLSAKLSALVGDDRQEVRLAA